VVALCHAPGGGAIEEPPATAQMNEDGREEMRPKPHFPASRAAHDGAMVIVASGASLARIALSFRRLAGERGEAVGALHTGTLQP
jgi:hypothetical protein